MLGERSTASWCGTESTIKSSHVLQSIWINKVKFKHFGYSILKAWVLLVVMVLLLLLLLLLCFRVTDASCYPSKNLFNVLISLFCGVIVSLFTTAINTYNESIHANNRIVELASNTCKKLELTINNHEKKDAIRILSDYCLEYQQIYRELCFLTESLAYEKNARKVLLAFYLIVERLMGIEFSKSKDLDLQTIKYYIFEISQNTCFL